MLARHAAAVVGMGTCWPWENAATLPSAARRSRGRRGVGHFVVAARLQLVRNCNSSGQARIKYSRLPVSLNTAHELVTDIMMLTERSH